MTLLLLVRHGQSTWNAAGRIQGWADPPLDDIGRQQARQLAQRLINESYNVAAIYTSPLARAWQTAEEVARPLKLVLHTDERLKENNVGQLTGLTGPEIEQQFPEWIAQFRQAGAEWVPPPGGEDREGFADRCVAAMTDIVARHPEQTVVVASHGGALGVYLAHLLEMPMHRHLPFQFDNASLSIVKVGGQRIRLVKFNDTSHLDNHKPEGP